LSIEAQIKETREVAMKLNIKIVEVLTESKSAKEPGRPGFNAMMKRLYRGDAQGILCWKLDRLARNPIDGASIIWAMKQNSLKVFTPAQAYSAEQENTILMYIEFGMAQKYIDDLSKNIKRGMRMKLEKGGWPATAPLGYLNDRLNKKILVDPERFTLIRKMWDLMLTGCYSVEDILDIANNEWGFRTRRWKHLGGKPLTKSMAYTILTNPFYAGLLQHRQGVYKGTHKTVVTQDEFDRVQELLGRNDRARREKYYFPFTGGMMKCGECGCSITAEHKVNRYGNHYVYYHCTKKKRNATCSQPCIEDKQLDEQVLAFLRKLSVPDNLGEWILNYVKYVDEENRLLTEDKIAMRKKTLDENRKQLDELNRMRYRGFLDDREFIREKAKLLQERNGLELKVGEADTANHHLFPFMKKAIQFAKVVPEWFVCAVPECKKLIMEVVGSNLILQDKSLLIQAQIPFIFFQEAKLIHISENLRIEPQYFVLPKLKAANPAATSSTPSSRMNDVRTFLEEHNDWVAKFERVWELYSSPT